jgi:hypothetical protein
MMRLTNSAIRFLVRACCGDLAIAPRNFPNIRQSSRNQVFQLIPVASETPTMQTLHKPSTALYGY